MVPLSNLLLGIAAFAATTLPVSAGLPFNVVDTHAHIIETTNGIQYLWCAPASG